ncbi:hypothetical protein BX600DRAFT_448374 [Xylariales sp. PMI_506]|nr:hypothetical protein BX600DRAFT_448374 [Xylariales sp. PMI_506]
MSNTPHHSPTKQSASQENLNGSGSWEMMDDEEIHHEEHASADTKPSSSHAQHSSEILAQHVSNLQRQQNRTPEPKKRNSQHNSVQPSPSTPGRLAPFDWDDFEGRYQKALAESDQKETELFDEFDRLVKYFNVWASAASSHDNERAIKRLQTRTRYVHLSEEKLKQKKEHRKSTIDNFIAVE